MTVSSSTDIFNQKYTSLKSDVNQIEREYANANSNNYKRLYPNLPQEEINTKIETDRLAVLNKLYVLLPTLQADTNLTPELMLREVNHASSKLLKLSDATAVSIALAESGILAGTSDKTIDINPFISEIEIPIKVGQKKEYIQIPDDEDPNTMVPSTDYLMVDDYKFEKVTVIKDKGSFENTINNIVNQAVLKATEQVDSQLENFNELIEQAKIKNETLDEVNLNRDSIRFETAKLLQELSSGKDIAVNNGTDVINLNWLNTTKRLNAGDHYLRLATDLQDALLDVNGIKPAEEEKSYQQRIPNPDGSGTFITTTTTKKFPIYKLEQFGASNFGKLLFDKVQIESQDENGNVTKTEDMSVFNLWKNNLSKELGQNLRTFLDDTDNLSISKQNDSKMYDLFINSLDVANTNTREVSGGNFNASDWAPNIPSNIFLEPVKEKSFLNGVQDILNSSANANNNNSNTQNNGMNSNLLMSNYNTGNSNNNNGGNIQQNSGQQNPQGLLTGNTGLNQNNNGGNNNQGVSQMSAADMDVIKDINTLQNVLGNWKS
jgi:hypothetical protein